VSVRKNLNIILIAGKLW